MLVYTKHCHLELILWASLTKRFSYPWEPLRQVEMTDDGQVNPNPRTEKRLTLVIR